MSKKEKFPLYLSPEKKAILERRYQEDGSRSITAFIERAVDFYLDYLSANNAGLFLPTSIKSYLDGRMGQLEERLSSIAFRQAVEQDMVPVSSPTRISSAARICAGGGRRAPKICEKPMAASRWSSGCVVHGRRTMSGRIDREKPLSQVRWWQFGQRLSAVHRHAGTGGDPPG